MARGHYPFPVLTSLSRVYLRRRVNRILSRFRSKRLVSVLLIYRITDKDRASQCTGEPTLRRIHHVFHQFDKPPFFYADLVLDIRYADSRQFPVVN